MLREQCLNSRGFLACSTRPKSTGRKARRGWDRELEYIYYYDIDSGKLEQREIGTVYGVTNLYKDVHNTRDVMQVEKKLSVLEGAASRVIIKIHDTIGKSTTISLLRPELETLRRFLFIMHYRNSGVSATYFQEDHPQNMLSGGWLQAYRCKLGVDSAADLWLHVMQYYLDQPHEAMIRETSEIMKKHAGPKRDLREMMNTCEDPDVRLHVLAYGLQAGSNYTCIWEAADGEEFLTGKYCGFGLWEGLYMGQPSIHRIFVTSPRIAIILRTNYADLIDKTKVWSNLLPIPSSQPYVVYRGRQGAFSEGVDDEATLLAYKSSAAAQNDEFRFTKTKLTIDQTYALNMTILQNANSRPDGSLTFLSAQSALRTLRRFCSPLSTETPARKAIFARLVETLTFPSLLPPTPTPPTSPKRNGRRRKSSAKNVIVTSTSNDVAPHVLSPPPCAQPLPAGVPSVHQQEKRSTSTAMNSPAIELSGPESQARILEDRLRSMIKAELGLAGTSQFATRYDAAYAIWRLCMHDEMPPGNPFVLDVRRTAADAYSEFVIAIKPPPRTFQPRPENRLVRSLPADKWTKAFSMLESLTVDHLGLPGPAVSFGLVLLRWEVAMLGFAERMAQTRHDILTGMAEKVNIQIIQ